MPATVQQVSEFLDQFAPLSTAESWDNVGLLLGDWCAEIETVMTCLTLTPDVAAEAIRQKVGLIVTHHPILFRAVQKLTTQTGEGKMLLELAANRIAVYSPHTAFDSAANGINQQWCDQLNLQQTEPLRPFEECSASNSTGSGRYGELGEPISLSQLMQDVKKNVGLNTLQYIGDTQKTIHKVGIACGAAAEYMHDAAGFGCDVLITGEARFHDCLAARTKGIALILVGHYASERFACEKLAEILQQQFSDVSTFASQQESDPIQFG